MLAGRRPVHSRTATAHSCGISVSASSRARTSSDRFVSCVDSAVIVAGHADWSVEAKAWNSSGGTPEVPGSPPTSFSATSRCHR